MSSLYWKPHFRKLKLWKTGREEKKSIDFLTDLCVVVGLWGHTFPSERDNAWEQVSQFTIVKVGLRREGWRRERGTRQGFYWFLRTNRRNCSGKSIWSGGGSVWRARDWRVARGCSTMLHIFPRFYHHQPYFLHITS